MNVVHILCLVVALLQPNQEWNLHTHRAWQLGALHMTFDLKVTTSKKELPPQPSRVLPDEPKYPAASRFIPELAPRIVYLSQHDTVPVPDSNWFLWLLAACFLLMLLSRRKPK